MRPGQVTEWLKRWRGGDRQAVDQIVPLVYRELREVAQRQLRHEPRTLTLSATALVHEVYLRLIRQRQIQAADRDAFLATAAQTMRRILVDHARARRRLKRGGHADAESLSDVHEVHLLTEPEVDEVLELDRVLARLAAADARAAHIVECRVFAGLTLEETAQALDVSVKTVQRTWLAARAFLRKEIRDGLGSHSLGAD